MRKFICLVWLSTVSLEWLIPCLIYLLAYRSSCVMSSHQIGVCLRSSFSWMPTWLHDCSIAISSWCVCVFYQLLLSMILCASLTSDAHLVAWLFDCFLRSLALSVEGRFEWVECSYYCVFALLRYPSRDPLRKSDLDACIFVWLLSWLLKSPFVCTHVKFERLFAPLLFVWIHCRPDVAHSLVLFCCALSLSLLGDWWLALLPPLNRSYCRSLPRQISLLLFFVHFVSHAHPSLLVPLLLLLSLSLSLC